MTNLKGSDGVRRHDILPEQSHLNAAVGLGSLLRPVHITFLLQIRRPSVENDRLLLISRYQRRRGYLRVHVQRDW